MVGQPDRIVAEPIEALGFRAFTTTRRAGSFGLMSPEPVSAVTARWTALLAGLAAQGAPALATATQVHGATVHSHGGRWTGWLRAAAADGHTTRERGVALAVTIADCTPVFLAHPSGAFALLHAGWRGTAAGILEVGIAALAGLGAPPDELAVHLGPAICGECYEVGPEVVQAVTGAPAGAPQRLDVRAVLAERARAAGVEAVTASALCTRCDGDRLYSHRAGDWGRQLAVAYRLPNAPNHDLT